MLVVKESDLQEIAQLGAEAFFESVKDKLRSPYPDVMNIKQVSEYLGFTEPTIRKLVKLKGLPVSDRCGDPRFVKSAVDAWLKGEL